MSGTVQIAHSFLCSSRRRWYVPSLWALRSSAAWTEARGRRLLATEPRLPAPGDILEVVPQPVCLDSPAETGQLPGQETPEGDHDSISRESFR